MSEYYVKTDKSMPYGCVAIIVRDAGQGQLEYVGVARREDADDWNLPGGKADVGELAAACVKREVLEETGLVIKRAWLLCAAPVISAEVGSPEYLVYTFICEVDQKQELNAAPGEGAVAWCSSDKVCSGRFGAYNAERLRIFLEETEMRIAIEPVQGMSREKLAHALETRGAYNVGVPDRGTTVECWADPVFADRFEQMIGVHSITKYPAQRRPESGRTLGVKEST